ncbi:amidase [Evansella vedderi]|uniref:Amidase n=1 Tax=Evansella vedderi TaxID=38282 RepID=A0ABT9ZNR4_9BACI|nr:amidase [Evansella vedderi]MDQ0252884.1 amidase [Evansella vedderi]
MSIRRPTLEQLKMIADKYNLFLTEDELASYQHTIDNTLVSYDRLSHYSEPRLPTKVPRTPGYRPDKWENPLNAWYWKTSIKDENATGKLSGKTVVLKDNVFLAGVPMMNGSRVLEGFVPDEDATIVRRILEAGGEIVGKAVNEDLCFSGGSHTSHTGPVRNPLDPSKMTGGSSSGSAALVGAREVDLAIGGDQGGSIRVPAAWCGICGLKPTYGLIPYTGIFPIDRSLDHTGPMASSVEDTALLLEVLAGKDGLDPRQSFFPVEPKKYTDYLTGDIRQLKVAIVEEGFGWKNLSDPEVDQAVLQSAYSLQHLGAKVERISIPWHKEGLHLWNIIAIEGGLKQMINENGVGTGWKGHYSTALTEFFHCRKKLLAKELSNTVKFVILLGEYMQQHGGKYYSTAQNISRRLNAAYDYALEHFDVLIMPTVPMKPLKIPGPDTSIEESIKIAVEVLINTAPFDITGHPSMTVPCSPSYPIGMMITGRIGEEETVLKVAHAYEQLNR